jgi:hypothetical protein
MKTTFSFTRRLPDHVSDEIAAVLSTQGSFEFKSLFSEVFSNLRKRNATSGGEEMLRLRTYEKLQNFVNVGIAQRTGKEYRAVAPALATYMEEAAQFKARLASGTPVRPPTLPVVAEKAKPVKKTVKNTVRKARASRAVS